jgi:GT2 family glycosyltransferase
MGKATNSISIVMITHNRREEVLASLEHLTQLPERPAILVVDHGSTDGTTESVAGRFPQVNILPAGRIGQNDFPQRDQSFDLLVLLLGR